jgi:hypothetical protein
LHRSGTTVLAHALQATGCFNTVTPFHLVYRDRLAAFRDKPELQEACRAELRDWFQRHRVRDRDYDAMPVGPDLPEEYGFALQKRGAGPRISDRNLPRFLEFANNVHCLDRERRPLLLKNPWETNNFLVLRRLFPQAQFIFNHRHPLSVVSSQLKMFGEVLRRPHPYDLLVDGEYRRLWRNPLRSRATRCLSSEKLPFLYWRIRKNAIRSCRYVLENSDKLEPCAIHVTYEEFCTSPDLWLDRILTFLNLTPGKPLGMGTAIRNPARPLHPAVERDREILLQSFAPYCARFGLSF